MTTGYAYVGPFFTLEDPQNICPWCIADGNAATAFHLVFVYDYDLEPVDDPTMKDELQHRTPGYFFATQYEWPTHCGDYCAVLRKVRWSDLEPLESELTADLDRLEVEDGTDRQAKREALQGTALWAYLFRCLKCGTYRLAGSYE